MTAFCLSVVIYVAFASLVLYRSPHYGWGFPLFVLVYPMFIVAWFFVAIGDVLSTWLGLAVLNMLVQFITIRRQTIPVNPTSTLLASLLLWPIQLAAALSNSSSDRTTAKSKAENRQALGNLPATIVGVVSYTHHLDIDKGYDAVWLEEYGELEFFVEAKRFDELRIQEGRRISITVDEREAPEHVGEGKVLWIVGDGTERAV
ncbi:MAG: hypothetical protein AAF660_03775 [Pseudomonadota bacterium]